MYTVDDMKLRKDIVMSFFFFKCFTKYVPIFIYRLCLVLNPCYGEMTRTMKKVALLQLRQWTIGKFIDKNLVAYQNQKDLEIKG